MEDRRVYLVLDAISPRLRGTVSVMLIVMGYLIQLTTTNILIGLPFVIACLVLNLLKSISIKRIRPKDLNWQEVTPDRIGQVLAQCERIKKFRNHSTLSAVIFFIIVVVFLSFIAPFLIHMFARISFPLLAAIVNAVILFLGLAVSGRRNAWMPPALDIKAKIVKRMLESPSIKDDPSLQAVPYLEMGETADGAFPNDTRLLLKFKDAAKEFIGLQGQISINSVKSRNYPYFYVVIIARPEFNLYDKYKKQALKNIVVERKKSGEVDVLVMRQKTTKTSGYHTNTAVQDYILKSGIAAAKSLL
ncbi:hypothetical protein AMJ87_12585 [candidate division WOR_3 bacterium SM23_60]|uniref:Uncharacterized protein n=1 Tax=candidate division WOR_3 bacterium SM23_60 TaxID=1703780 RepID=A0A0S8G5X4_UNCW3|nr:MAG: hypothetical protein AMJ87_12585 [candidate division WOR_3 bacterium SM23_60]